MLIWNLTIFKKSIWIFEVKVNKISSVGFFLSDQTDFKGYLVMAANSQPVTTSKLISKEWVADLHDATT